MDASATKVPQSAAWLGGLGAVPFISLAGMTPFITGPLRLLVVQALVAYGATILSFLGGVHWGLAIGSRDGADPGRLPARAAWAALLCPQTAGLFILALSIAAMLWVDVRATQSGDAPPWYPKLRIPLTSMVVASLLLGAILQITASHHGPPGRSDPSRSVIT
jgi:hypothetical protein